MRPMTITEKIIARAAGVDAVEPGDEVWARVDLAVMNDSSGPRRIAPLLEEMGGRIWDKSKVVLASDHFVPACNLRHAQILSVTREWAASQRLPHFYDFQGILHNLVLEKFHVLPGMLIAGADSHTVTAGAMGAVAVGISSTELATIVATGEIWLRVPPTIRIELVGELPPWAMIRDVTMRILWQLGSDFGLYRAIEFTGGAVASWSIAERLVLSNQSIEMGAKNGTVPPDETLLRELKMAGVTHTFTPVYSEPDCEYESTHTFNIAEMVPMVCCPHTVDNVREVERLENVELTQAYIGSCVGGGSMDLMAAARVLEGRRTKIPLMVAPATQEVYRTCLENGVLQILTEAGAVIMAAGCGACAGLHSGVLGPGDRCIATVTRNFRGRMGHPSAEIYLASAYTVAASAVEGRITSPAPYLIG